MQNIESIVLDRTSDTELRINDPCASLWVPCSSGLQPIVGWIHLKHFKRPNATTIRVFLVNYGDRDISKQIEQRERGGKIFARWQLAIPISRNNNNNKYFEITIAVLIKIYFVFTAIFH